MSLKVIGAGFGRTGTLSLKGALEQLGFAKCYHMMEVSQHPDHMQTWAQAHNGKAIDWDQLFTGYEATVDWPSCNLWREQAAHYPQAKILLSLRDPDAWYDSVMNTIYPSSSALIDSDDDNLKAFGTWVMDVIWNYVFDGKMDDRQHVINQFNRHNQAVIDEVPSDRLLVFDAKQGWQPLCEFLDVPVPDTEYPHTNTTKQFKERNTAKDS
jgi:hypothetical protein